jgi:hypothetical protein
MSKLVITHCKGRPTDVPVAAINVQTGAVHLHASHGNLSVRSYTLTDKGTVHSPYTVQQLLDAAGNRRAIYRGDTVTITF